MVAFAARSPSRRWAVASTDSRVHCRRPRQLRGFTHCSRYRVIVEELSQEGAMLVAKDNMAESMSKILAWVAIKRTSKAPWRRVSRFVRN